MRQLKSQPQLTLMGWIFISSTLSFLGAFLVTGEKFRGYLIGNIIFIITLTGLVAVSRIPKVLQYRDAWIVLLSLSLLAAIAFCGFIIAEDSPWLAILLAGPIATIGFYPPGSDVWLPFGIAIWITSTFAVTIGSCIIGTVISRFLEIRDSY